MAAWCGVLVSTSRAPDVTSPEQLDREGVVLAVQRKTTGEEKARAHFPAAQIRTYDNELDAANEVAAGRADAFVYDMVSVVKLHNRHRNATHIVEADLGTELYCIAWRKGSEEAALVDAFLARESRPGGLIDQMLEKWLGDAARFRVDED